MKEVYKYNLNFNSTKKGGSVKNSLITLEDTELSQYTSIGFFMHPDSIPDDKMIYFNNRQGLLGYKVFTSRGFQDMDR